MRAAAAAAIPAHGFRSALPPRRLRRGEDARRVQQVRNGVGLVAHLVLLARASAARLDRRLPPSRAPKFATNDPPHAWHFTEVPFFSSARMRYSAQRTSLPRTSGFAASCSPRVPHLLRHGSHSVIHRGASLYQRAVIWLPMPPPRWSGSSDPWSMPNSRACSRANHMLHQPVSFTVRCSGTQLR